MNATTSVLEDNRVLDAGADASGVMHPAVRRSTRVATAAPAAAATQMPRKVDVSVDAGTAALSGEGLLRGLRARSQAAGCDGARSCVMAHMPLIVSMREPKRMESIDGALIWVMRLFVSVGMRVDGGGQRRTRSLTDVSAGAAMGTLKRRSAPALSGRVQLAPRRPARLVMTYAAVTVVRAPRKVAHASRRMQLVPTQQGTPLAAQLNAVRVESASKQRDECAASDGATAACAVPNAAAAAAVVALGGAAHACGDALLAAIAADMAAGARDGVSRSGEAAAAEAAGKRAQHRLLRVPAAQAQWRHTHKQRQRQTGPTLWVQARAAQRTLA